MSDVPEYTMLRGYIAHAASVTHATIYVISVPIVSSFKLSGPLCDTMYISAESVYMLSPTL